MAQDLSGSQTLWWFALCNEKTFRSPATTVCLLPHLFKSPLIQRLKLLHKTCDPFAYSLTSSSKLPSFMCMSQIMYNVPYSSIFPLVQPETRLHFVTTSSRSSLLDRPPTGAPEDETAFLCGLSSSKTTSEYPSVPSWRLGPLRQDGTAIRQSQAQL